MFNESRKMDYLQTYVSDSSRSSAARIFEKSEEYEIDADKDIAMMSEEELSELLIDVSSIQRRNSKAAIGVIRRYRAWCAKSGYDTIGVSEIHVDISEKIRKKMVSSPAMLQAFMDGLFDPTEDQTVHCVYRAYIWLLFAGVEKEVIHSITAKDVDFYIPCVYVGSIGYLLPAESLMAIHLCCDNTAFLYSHPKYRSSMRRRIDGDSIMRGFKAVLLPLYIKIEYYNLINAKDVQPLSFSNIIRSGEFYRQYQLELAGKPTDIEPYVQRCLVQRLENISRATPRKIKKLTTEIRTCYKTDYANWKKAFYG